MTQRIKTTPTRLCIRLTDHSLFILWRCDRPLSPPLSFFTGQIPSNALTSLGYYMGIGEDTRKRLTIAQYHQNQTFHLLSYRIAFQLSLQQTHTTKNRCLPFGRGDSGKRYVHSICRHLSILSLNESCAWLLIDCLCKQERDQHPGFFIHVLFFVSYFFLFTFYRILLWRARIQLHRRLLRRAPSRPTRGCLQVSVVSSQGSFG